MQDFTKSVESDQARDLLPSLGTSSYSMTWQRWAMITEEEVILGKMANRRCLQRELFK